MTELTWLIKVMFPEKPIKSIDELIDRITDQEAINDRQR